MCALRCCISDQRKGLCFWRHRHGERDKKIFLRWALRAKTQGLLEAVRAGSHPPAWGLCFSIFASWMELSPFAARAQQSLFPFEVLRELQEVKKIPVVGARISWIESLFGASGNTSRGMQGRAGCGEHWAEHLKAGLLFKVLHGFIAVPGSWNRERLQELRMDPRLCTFPRCSCCAVTRDGAG